MAKKNISQLPGDGRKLASDLKKQFTKAIRECAAAMQAHYKGSFKKQGYADGVSKWQSRKNNRDEGRAILIESGDLRRSIKAKVSGSRSIIISSDVEYAKIHNEGGNIRGTQTVKEHRRKRGSNSSTVKSHSRRVNIIMPKRQFMPVDGDNIGVDLQEKLIKIVKRNIDDSIKL